MEFRGFNDAINGFIDDGWSLLTSDGAEDVSIAINSNPNKFPGSPYNTSMLPAFGGVLCAKASMLLQVHPCLKPSIFDLVSLYQTILCF